MIDIHISRELFRYDAYHITKAFYPNEEIQIHIIESSRTIKNFQNKQYFLKFHRDDNLIFSIENDVNLKVSTWYSDSCDGILDKELKHYINQSLYLNLVDFTGKELDWGFMTGIRPTKITMKKYQEFLNEKNHMNYDIDLRTRQWLEQYYNVSSSKSQLALEVVKEEINLLETADLENGYSLYIGIPFCKTKCTYCSFTAFPLDKWKERMDEYLEALYKELRFIADRSRNKILDAIYIGGGTPTSLEAYQLDALFKVLEENFPYSQVKEITVEAGRPDTITVEKLLVMKKHGVHRISINPQTMNQDTLNRVGRSHSVEEIKSVFKEARELGFDNINMDLILGLPGEDIENVRNTLEEIKKLTPDSLTVHSLAMKRSSQMNITSTKLDESDIIRDMVSLSMSEALDMSLTPYYLYRQKSIAGNYENIGYAKKGKACLYNVLIMEEKQSIVAAGAGSASKILLKRKDKNILRIENVKDVNEYISRIDEMIVRKGECLWP